MEKESEKKEKKRFFPQWMSFSLAVTVASFVIILFLQDNSVFKYYEYDKQIKELKGEIKENLDSAEYYNRKSQELNSDPESLEKISREQYHMKRPHEDVYVTDIK